VPGIYYGYRKKHEMTDIKTLVRKLLAGKLPQKEMPELWQRHDVTQYMQREWDRCAKPAEDDLLRESRIWERIVARTMPHEKIRLFQKYEHSREKLIQLLSYGMRIEEIIAICSNTEIWQLVDCDCQYAS